MISVRNINHTLRLFLLIVFMLLIALAIFVISTHAQTAPAVRPAQASQLAATAARFDNYKGATIGMTATEVRQKLGTPTEASDQQDFYFFSEEESAQIAYDQSHKVRAMAINFLGAKAPTPEQVLGIPLVPDADGSLYKRVTYQPNGFWVAYSRTAGPAPVVSITIARIIQ
jgi:outer membrane protein assembly factor BamE (lipoprotein component of BamABCDE complex)